MADAPGLVPVDQQLEILAAVRSGVNAGGPECSEGGDMTEKEWERSEDSVRMLVFLREQAGGGKATLFGLRAQGRRKQAGSRKLRLFACACARLLWDQLNREASRRLVELAERYADGRVTRRDLTADAAGPSRASGRWGMAAEVARAAAYADDFDAADHASLRACQAGVDDAALVALLRCLFGNPFLPPPVVAEEVVAANGGAARRLADAIYAGRRFADLPVLADLLEEAGLTDAALLGHLRGPGPHALGCHALDAVLRKS